VLEVIVAAREAQIDIVQDEWATLIDEEGFQGVFFFECRAGTARKFEQHCCLFSTYTFPMAFEMKNT